jgi:protein tyrosine phosphatase (PTP) superfamily phosphohydrolase (DUF442 family)
MELKMRISALVLCCLFAVTSVAEIKPYDTPQRGELSGVQDFFAQVAPRVWVSGQPNAAAFTELKNMGVATVINLRTSQEMDNRQVVPFDEAQTLAELGIDYVHIPQGGPDALGSAEGNLLLHCTVAWRASHMWAAYLVAHQGVSVDDAVAIGKQMNMGGYPFAEFLEREVSLR